MKQIVLVVASDGYQPLEYEKPKKLLEAAGIGVVTASDTAGAAFAAHDNSETPVNLLIDEVDPKQYDGLFFIGGPGALEYLDNESSYDLLRRWRESDKPYGSICISTRILAKAGVLKNKRATGWNNDGKLPGILLEGDAEFIEEHVVVDGQLITASGPEVAEEFGEEIIRLIDTSNI